MGRQITGTTILKGEKEQVQKFVPTTNNKIKMAKDGVSQDRQKMINRDLFINCMRLKSIVK